MSSSKLLDTFTITINPDQMPDQFSDESDHVLALRVIAALLRVKMFEFWSVVCVDPYCRNREVIGVYAVKSLFRGTANAKVFSDKCDYIVVTEDNIDIFEKVCRAVEDVGLVSSRKRKTGREGWDDANCRREFARYDHAPPEDMFIVEMFTLLTTGLPPGSDYVLRLNKVERLWFDKLLDYFNINVDNDYVDPKPAELKQLKAAVSAAIVVGNW